MSRDVPPRIRFKVCGMFLTVLLIAFAFGSAIFSDNHVFRGLERAIVRRV